MKCVECNVHKLIRYKLRGVLVTISMLQIQVSLSLPTLNSFSVPMQSSVNKHTGWTQKSSPPPCDFGWYFSRKCRFFHEILRDSSNQIYILSPSFVEIYQKMTKLCCFNQDNPPFSVFERHAKLKALMHGYHTKGGLFCAQNLRLWDISHRPFVHS